MANKVRLHNATIIQDRIVSRSSQVKDYMINAESEKLKGTDALEDIAKVKPILRKSSLIDANNSKKVITDQTKSSKTAVKRSENSKSKPGYCVKTNVTRKALRDIGNVGHNLFETKSSRPWKGNSGRISYPAIHKDAVDSAMEASSSKQPLRVKRVSIDANLTHASDENKNSKKSSVGKTIKTTSRGTKLRIHLATARNSARNHLHETRKSLPVLKQSSRVESSSRTKEFSDKSATVREKHGIPVKPSIRRITVPKPFNLSHRTSRNRVGDGFIPVASRAATKADSAALSKKLAKPTRKSALLVPSDDLSKAKQVKNSSSVASNEEPSQEEDSSVGNTTWGKCSKSDRRNSFTSSLIMSTSKLKGVDKNDAPLSLPKIDDESNHLEVCEYVDDIYQYYWVLEGQNPLLKNYMQTQQDVKPQMRGILINWLIEVHEKFKLMEETLFLTVALLDKYLSLEATTKKEMQLVGLTAFLLASKYEDFWHPRVSDLISISTDSYTRDQMLEMEKKILKKLNYRLNQPTPYVFMLRFLKAAQSQMKKFEYLAFYLLELCLVNDEALNYKPSLLCAAAIYLARCTMQMTPVWTPLLAKHARYEESQIRVCSEMILKFHKAAKTSLLKVVHDKYMKDEHGRVAAIKPLARLPAL